MSQLMYIKVVLFKDIINLLKYIVFFLVDNNILLLLPLLKKISFPTSIWILKYSGNKITNSYASA